MTCTDKDLVTRSLEKIVLVIHPLAQKVKKVSSLKRENNWKLTTIERLGSEIVLPTLSDT